MTKRILFIIYLIVSFSNIQSQVSQEWVRRYGEQTNGFYNIAGIKTDRTGNVYVSGSIQGATLTDYLTVKYSSDGTLQWAKVYTGLIEDRVIDMALDTSGNVYVTGLSENTTGTYDIITIKYDQNGDSLWVKRYNGAHAFTMDQPTAMFIDRNNFVYVCGYSFGSSPSEYVIIKYNSNGDTIWSAHPAMAGTNIPSDIYVDINSNVYVYGRELSILKYDSSGSLLWNRTYSYNSAESNRVITGDDSGNIYFGAMKWTATFGDFTIVKIDPNGDVVWEVVRNAFGGTAATHDETKAICLDPSGNVYLTGEIYNAGAYHFATIKVSSSGIFRWEKNHTPVLNGAGGEDIVSDKYGNAYITGGSRDYEIIKYNPAGDSAWVMHYDGPANLGDRGKFITLDASGNVIVTGLSQRNISPANYDLATIKFSQSQKKLILKSLIEGFWNSSSNQMIMDTMKVTLRSSAAPYNIVSSGKGLPDANGNAVIYFDQQVQNSTPYYIQLTHRNSIETWSGDPQSFTGNELTYEFYSSASQAFGNNQKQVDASPIRYAIYGGDVNQDGSVELTDIVNVFNDAYNFISGYAATDVTGDSIVDLSDLALTWNNGSNFVVKAVP